MEAQGFEMNILSNNNQNVPLFPKTTVEQVNGWNIGEVFGPFVFNLQSNAWISNKQSVSLVGIEANDTPVCIKILTGTEEEMENQDKAYSLLDPEQGIESFDNTIKFTCVETPNVDFQVQVWWTR